jgi:hypothetical protein
MFVYTPIKNIIAHPFPTLENNYRSDYPSNFDSQDKILLIATGCWVILSSSHLDPSTGEVMVGGYPARADGLINALSAKRYDLDKAVHLYGWKPSGDFETHTVSIHQALREKNVGALVYTNAPGGLQAFVELEANLGVERALAEIKREYPEAAPFAETYLDALRKSVGRHVAKTERALEAPKDLFKGVAAQLAPLRSFKGLWNALGLTPANSDPPLAKAPPSPPALSGQASQLAAEFDKVMQTASETYGKDGSTTYPYRPMMPVKEFWSCSGGIFDPWLRMVLTMAKSKNVPFVFYIPPHLQIEESQKELFHKNFTARVEAILAEFPNAHLVDHSSLPGMNCCDLAPIRRREVAKPFRIIFWNPGYIFNLVGKIKTMRNLMAALSERGLVKARRGDPRAPLPEELAPRCPPAQRAYTFDYPEDSMQPPNLTLSSPLSNENYKDYLCAVWNRITR